MDTVNCMDTKGARALAERLEEARLQEELRQEAEAEVEDVNGADRDARLAEAGEQRVQRAVQGRGGAEGEE